MARSTCAASCSQSQLTVRSARAATHLTWEAASINVHRSPSPTAAIVTHLVTRLTRMLGRASSCPNPLFGRELHAHPPPALLTVTCWNAAQHCAAFQVLSAVVRPESGHRPPRGCLQRPSMRTNHGAVEVAGTGPQKVKSMRLSWTVDDFIDRFSDQPWKFGDCFFQQPFDWNGVAAVIDVYML